ncbi:hypothetical protein [Anabaena sp. PCC 7108]|uniref:hypothetical protein n=1 Tax=Anabaena sp. PCC 7108 TaxID=163908 RepID=UPI00034526FB|nr:hypothetical protein [Anabaena sp. PCC 7108]
MSSKVSDEIDQEIIGYCFYWEQQLSKYKEQLLRIIEEEKVFTQNARKKMKDWQEHLKLDADICEIFYINFANELYKKNQINLALLMFDEVINMQNSLVPIAYETKGYILYLEGEKDKGINEIKNALRCYNELNSNTKKAEELDKILRELKPVNHFLDNLFRSLFIWK